MPAANQFRVDGTDSKWQPFGTLLIRYNGDWVETGSTVTLHKLIQPRYADGPRPVTFRRRIVRFRPLRAWRAAGLMDTSIRPFIALTARTRV